MPRAPRVQAPGAAYHVMAHGNEQRQPIFLDDADRGRFLAMLRETSERRVWTHLAHCLMTTHFHFVVITEFPNLSDGMRDLLALYARHFNRRHKRAGHLFRDRFLSVLIKDDRQLMAVLRYVAWNPIDAGIVSAARDWKWSSYDETVRGAAASSSLDIAAVLALVHRNPLRARQILREVVEGELVTRGVGSATSVRQAGATLHTLAQVLTPNEAIAAAGRHGFHRDQIADALGLTPSTVGRRLRRLARARGLENDSPSGAIQTPAIDSGTGRGV